MSPLLETCLRRRTGMQRHNFRHTRSEVCLVLKYFWGPSSLLSKEDGNCATGFDGGCSVKLTAHISSGKFKNMRNFSLYYRTSFYGVVDPVDAVLTPQFSAGHNREFTVW
jgi:hypothetical protein